MPISMVYLGHTNNTKGNETMSKFDVTVQCEETFTTATLYISDCCGEYLAMEQAEYEICPRCHEHCEVLTEEYPHQRG